MDYLLEALLVIGFFAVYIAVVSVLVLLNSKEIIDDMNGEKKDD